ncbi:hypothetical protein NIB75_13980 [Bacteroides uniformis]|nr:hypothetical protein [Bacteroides uniformis]
MPHLGRAEVWHPGRWRVASGALACGIRGAEVWHPERWRVAFRMPECGVSAGFLFRLFR